VGHAVLSSACFEHSNVHHQEDLYMQFYGTFVMYSLVDGSMCLPGDEHLVVRNMLDTL